MDLNCRVELFDLGQGRPNSIHFVIPSEVEESLSLFSFEIRDVSAALDMTSRVVTPRFVSLAENIVADTDDAGVDSKKKRAED